MPVAPSASCQPGASPENYNARGLRHKLGMLRFATLDSLRRPDKKWFLFLFCFFKVGGGGGRIFRNGLTCTNINVK